MLNTRLIRWTLATCITLITSLVAGYANSLFWIFLHSGIRLDYILAIACIGPAISIMVLEAKDRRDTISALFFVWIASLVVGCMPITLLGTVFDQNGPGMDPGSGIRAGLGWAFIVPAIVFIVIGMHLFIKTCYRLLRRSQ